MTEVDLLYRKLRNMEELEMRMLKAQGKTRILFSGIRTDNGKKVVGYYVRLEDPSKKKVSCRIYPGYAEAERDGDEYAFYPDFYEVDPVSLRIELVGDL